MSSPVTWRILVASLALAASPALAADPQPTTAAIPNDVVATAPAARPASVEVFKPAPLPNESLSDAPTSVASDEPNLHPDLLRMSEHGSGALGDTSSEYQREARVSPAGGMSLSIPVQ